MPLKITKGVIAEIHAHSESTYPEECCGLLIADGTKTVTESVRMRNAYEGTKYDRYSIDPLELFKADRTVSQRGLTIAGIYHSHPDYPATLSKFDLDHSFQWYSYIIVSVPKGKAKDTRLWHPSEDRASSSEGTLEIK
jgi:proteasome lid subunit RPN8/RPN11